MAQLGLGPFGSSSSSSASPQPAHSVVLASSHTISPLQNPRLGPALIDRRPMATARLRSAASLRGVLLRHFSVGPASTPHAVSRVPGSGSCSSPASRPLSSSPPVVSQRVNFQPPPRMMTSQRLKCCDFLVVLFLI
jgi:hypothetical protein